MPSPADRARGLLVLAGLLLAGYGGLVATRVLVHEAFGVGLGMLLAGAVLLAFAARAAPRPRGPPQDPATAATPATTQGPSRPAARALAVALMGVLAAAGVLAYNLLARSSLSPPEVAILAYGVALVAAAPALGRRVLGGRTDVGALVAWSFPLVAAPLGLYALDAALSAGGRSSFVDAAVEVALVRPVGWALAIAGFDAATTGQTVALGTPRGTLFLGIGLACAGLHPSVLFLGAFGFHAFREDTPPPRLALVLLVGLAGVYLANLVRLLALALVGYQWGGAALQTAHQHFGWAIFLVWMLAFWLVVLRRLEGPARAQPPPPPPTSGPSVRS